MNIFLNTYDTPHNCTPFDKIRFEDYEPAMREGMKRELEEIQKILDNPEEATFQNTILPRTDELLSRVTTVFFNLLSANTDSRLDELAQRISPILTQHTNEILLNPQLFERVKHVRETARNLDSEEQMLLNKTFEAFERNGANLAPADKIRFTKLVMQLSQLTLKFSQNSLNETKAYQLHIKDKKNLAGLHDSAIEAAALAARERGKKGWLFTLDAPSYNAFITYAENRQLREEIFRAKNTLGTKEGKYCNLAVAKRIVNLRREIAQLLGYKNYAQYVLSRRMAGSEQAVTDLLQQLLSAYLPKAREEVREVEQLAKRQMGKDFVLQPWDFAFYSHKLKLEKYNFDAEEFRPYLQLERVTQGVFGLATRLYGISFKRNTEIPTYHPDVEAYEVFDRDGSYLAILYADFFPRTGKQSGAWMTNFQEQYVDARGADHRPHVSITMNLTKPTAEKPSLLTLDEVETFLHEFGHALHGMFSQVRFESLSGTNVYWDFVELPSQFMENFLLEPEFLNSFARHYETGQPVPEDLIARARMSRNFMCGYSCVRQLSFAFLDMAYYTRQKQLRQDVRKFEQAVGRKTRLLPLVKEACMTTQFGHIMSGGYASGYYSYKWAEVLDADAFACFQEDGTFSPRVAARFRECILSRGGTQEPMELYVKFRGQKPTIDALLRRNGIDPKQNKKYKTQKHG